MGLTRSLANYWGKKEKILDMYLTLIETYWWGDGDDDDDDKKNEARSQQVLNSWQLGIHSYSYETYTPN